MSVRENMKRACGRSILSEQCSYPNCLCPKHHDDETHLRNQFAGQALQGMLAHAVRYRPREPGGDWHASIAREAYELADAMLVARVATRVAGLWEYAEAAADGIPHDDDDHGGTAHD